MVSYNQDYVTDRFYFEEEPFDSLMQKRIIEILLVCSNYDRFILESDGRIDELIFEEYVALNLRYPPRFSTAATPEEALALLDTRSFDLVITMVGMGQTQGLELAQQIKRRYPGTETAVLTRYSGEVVEELERIDPSAVDHVFCWLGNANILLAVVKLIEDRMNADHDVGEVGVQAIVLVEDSVRYYSSYLPIIYRLLFQQTAQLMREGLNAHQRMMRMRGRPKILLATNYEEAIALYERYRTNVLGVISDIAYKREGRHDRVAGLALCRQIRARNPDLPILLQSSQEQHAAEAQAIGAAFIHKHSKSLHNELRHFIRNNFGFGDFVFRMPDTMIEADRAADLVDLQHKLETVPLAAVEYHVRNHHVSKWLKARALFSLANIIRPKRLEDFASIAAARDYLVDTIRNYRMHVGRGVIAHFDSKKFDEYWVLERIGQGSLGGKARGLAFINTFLKRNRIMFRFEGTSVQIPKTVVLTTEVFEEFMEKNGLESTAKSDAPDEVVLERFLHGRLPAALYPDLRALVSVVRNPLAVRSSSVLEDSQHFPFAGIYSTYMLPNNDPDVNVRIRHLADAIRGVFASTYSRSAKSYAAANQNFVDEERMAVVVQEVAGKAYGDVYYPTLSGVARSLNYYATGRERAEEGVVNVALGLGKTVVDGHVCLRFSPAHPKKIFQLSTPELALRTTQQHFFGIDLRPGSFAVTTDEARNLLHLEVADAAPYPANQLLLSTYDHQHNTVRDNARLTGRKVVTFAPILKHGAFPLAEIVQTLLELGQREMAVPVEIEFAALLDVPADRPRMFKFLQIRPIVEGFEAETVRVDGTPPEQCLIRASWALGNGLYDGLHDVVYVRPDAFDRARTREIVESLDRVNRRLRDEDRGYLLVGPGRWGTTDPWLGVPVQWSHITNARVIVEASLKGFAVEPSQGSHFWQNLTAFRVAYLTANPAAGVDSYDVRFLDAHAALQEDALVRHVRFDAPVRVKIDGRKPAGEIKAVVLKPGVEDDAPRPARRRSGS